MTRYVLGIEIGTTLINVSIFNVDTKEVVEHYSQHTNCNVPVDNIEGAHEQCVPKIIHVLNSCIEKIKPNFRQSLSHIGVCGQMHGVVLWKNENEEKPWKFVNNEYTIDEQKVSNLYTWQDARCNPKFLESLPEPESHLGISTGFGIPTMFWLNKNDPKLLKKYNRSGLISSFVVAMLSNEDQVYTSFQNAASWGYFNCKDLQWNVHILEESNFPVELLPEVKSSGVFVGNLSQSWYGIPTGIPIGVDLGNVQCSVLSTIETLEDAVIYLSSSAHIAFVINNYTPMNRPPKIQPLNFWPYFNSMYVGMADSLNGGNTLNFFVNMLESWFSDLGVNVDRITMWDTLTRLGMNFKSDPTLNISPTCLGERFDPQLTASVTNITDLNLSLGEVFKALCRGLVENLHSQLSLTTLKKSKCNRLIVTGSALDKNLLLRNEVERVYKLPLVFTLAGDASKGAALAMHTYGVAEAIKRPLVNDTVNSDLARMELPTPIVASRRTVDLGTSAPSIPPTLDPDSSSTGSDNVTKSCQCPANCKCKSKSSKNYLILLLSDMDVSTNNNFSKVSATLPPSQSKDIPIGLSQNKTNQYTFEDSSEFSQFSSSPKYKDLPKEPKTNKIYSTNETSQFSHTFSPIPSDLPTPTTRSPSTQKEDMQKIKLTLGLTSDQASSEFPMLIATNKIIRNSDEDYSEFLELQKATLRQTSDLESDLPKEPKKYKYFSIDASQFLHKSTQTATAIPTSTATTTTDFLEEDKLRNGEIQKGTPRSGLSSELPSFSRSARIKTNDLTSQQTRNLPKNNLDYSSDDTFPYSPKSNDIPIGSRKYKNYNSHRSISKFLPASTQTTNELTASATNKSNHYKVDGFQKYSKISTSQKYSELPIKFKRYKTFSTDGASQFSHRSTQTTSDLATSMSRPTQYQLSKEDKLKYIEIQKSKATSDLSRSAPITSELPISSTTNKTTLNDYSKFSQSSPKHSNSPKQSRAYKKYSIDGSSQFSQTFSPIPSDFQTSITKSLATQKEDKQKITPKLGLPSDQSSVPKSSEFPLSATNIINTNSDEDYSKFLVTQKAASSQTSDLPKKYKYFSIDDASQFSHKSTQTTTDFPTSITTTTQFQEKDKLRKGEIQNGTHRSWISSELPSFPRSAPLKTNDLASQQTRNKIDHSTDNTSPYSLKTNDVLIGSRKYTNYNSLRSTSQTTSDIPTSATNNSNHYIVDGNRKYRQTTTTKKYSELPIKSKKYKTIAMDGPFQFSHISTQTTSDWATSMSRPTQFQLSEEDKIRRSEIQKSKPTSGLSSDLSRSNDYSEFSQPSPKYSNLPKQSRTYKTFSMNGDSQFSNTSTQTTNDLATSMLKPTQFQLSEEDKLRNSEIQKGKQTSDARSFPIPTSPTILESTSSDRYDLEAVDTLPSPKTGNLRMPSIMETSDKTNYLTISGSEKNVVKLVLDSTSDQALGARSTSLKTSDLSITPTKNNTNYYTVEDDAANSYEEYSKYLLLQKSSSSKNSDLPEEPKKYKTFSMDGASQLSISKTIQEEAKTRNDVILEYKKTSRLSSDLTPLPKSTETYKTYTEIDIPRASRNKSTYLPISDIKLAQKKNGDIGKVGQSVETDSQASEFQSLDGDSDLEGPSTPVMSNILTRPPRLVQSNISRDVTPAVNSIRMSNQASESSFYDSMRFWDGLPTPIPAIPNYLAFSTGQFPNLPRKNSVEVPLSTVESDSGHFRTPIMSALLVTPPIPNNEPATVSVAGSASGTTPAPTTVLRSMPTPMSTSMSSSVLSSVPAPVPALVPEQPATPVMSNILVPKIRYPHI